MVKSGKNAVKLKFKQPPMRDIDFQVDTTSVDYNRLAYMDPYDKTITRNYRKGEEEFNKLSQSDYVLIHEQKHRDNYNKGMYEYPVSTEMAYKLNMHDEISAHMASLIYLRQKYLETGDVSVFDQGADGCFDFYKKAIQQGKVKPGSPYQEDFDKEMRLIANGTQKMWLEKYGELYIGQMSRFSVLFDDASGAYSQYYNENYKNGRKIALNVGGVDFTRYLDKDVEIPRRQEVLTAINKVLTTTRKSPSVKERKRPNEPIHPVDKEEPYYDEEWMDMEGYRRSKVQHRRLPDLTKDVIQKPTTSYVSEQKKFLNDKDILKQQMKNEAGPNKTSVKEKMKTDFKKYSAAKQRLTAQNDAIPTSRKQIEQTLRFHRPGVTPQKDTKRKLADIFKSKQNSVRQF